MPLWLDITFISPVDMVISYIFECVIYFNNLYVQLCCFVQLIYIPNLNSIFYGVFIIYFILIQILFLQINHYLLNLLTVKKIKLGFLKLEAEFTKFISIGPKSYIGVRADFVFTIKPN